ncbi:hypothetical protein N7532_003257 [Penicillium argentinense]|uniref:Uncharacterized protein n=1 Tax=Penicillium argentinense TaxID=1131581 RepID=A0A9W9FM47_9EURO|nr:uncharacterized protein N7532_003257 [Penicillium argentinense]KAJ5102728.1 hypothetical protein N7532_003257 [Penicillium argentinense]
MLHLRLAHAPAPSCILRVPGSHGLFPIPLR